MIKKFKTLAWKYWCLWPIALVAIAFCLVLYGIDYVFEQRAYRRWERYSYDSVNRLLEEGQKVDDKAELLRKLQEIGSNRVPRCNCTTSQPKSSSIQGLEKLINTVHVDKLSVNSSVDKLNCDHLDPQKRDLILILTPSRQLGTVVKRYFHNLLNFEYPHCRIRIAIGVNEDDSSTFNLVHSYASSLEHDFNKIDIYKLHMKNSDFHMNDINRHQENIQLERRSHLAQVRNALLFRALSDEKWVLWLDSDVRELPADLLTSLLSTGKEIIVPSCMYRKTPKTLAVYDKNSWQETNESYKSHTGINQGILLAEGYNQTKRLYLNDIQSEGPIVKLDGIGGCCLLVQADIHRKGVIFLPFVYKNHIETEGFAQAAKAMGYKLHGMPFVQVIH